MAAPRPHVERCRCDCARCRSCWRKSRQLSALDKAYERLPAWAQMVIMLTVITVVLAAIAAPIACTVIVALEALGVRNTLS